MGTELDSVRKACKSVNQAEQRSTRVSSGTRVFFDLFLWSESQYNPVDVFRNLNLTSQTTVIFYEERLI